MTTELCVARTTLTDPNVCWPDRTNSKCFFDWATPTQDLSVPVHKSITECCKKGVHWLTEAACLTDSGNSTALIACNIYFVDWEHQHCIQDCEGTAPCGGLGQVQLWDETYDYTQSCCDVISWI